MAMVDIDYDPNPEYCFTSEMHALETLEQLAIQLEAERKLVKHTMKHMRAAMLASQDQNGDDGPVSKEAVITASRLSRRTVYGVLGGQKGK